MSHARLASTSTARIQMAHSGSITSRLPAFSPIPGKNPNWPIDPSEANNAVVRALTETVPEGTSVARDWAAASTYVRRHLAAHAARRGKS